jgi:hypothetical protein
LVLGIDEMREIVQQFFNAIEKKLPRCPPDKLLPTYLDAAKALGDQKGLRQLTIFQDFLYSRLSPIDLDPATLLLCKRVAKRMVKLRIWPDNVLDQFSLPKQMKLVELDHAPISFETSIFS